METDQYLSEWRRKRILRSSFPAVKVARRIFAVRRLFGQSRQVIRRPFPGERAALSSSAAALSAAKSVLSLAGRSFFSPPRSPPQKTRPLNVVSSYCSCLRDHPSVGAPAFCRDSPKTQRQPCPRQSAIISTTAVRRSGELPEFLSAACVLF